MRAVAKFWGFYICVYILILAWGYYRGIYAMMNLTELLTLIAKVAAVTLVLAIISRILLVLWDTERVVAKVICLVIAALIAFFVVQQIRVLIM